MASDLFNKLHDILLPAHAEYQTRIEQELTTLEDNECLSIFFDFYQQVKKGELETANDVNKVNSLCAYLLGMSTVKPTGEMAIASMRTYARDGFPDVDMDFCKFRRKEVIAYIIGKYGVDCVSKIGTVGKLKLKSALRRVIKVLDPGNFTAYDANGKQIRDENNAAFQLENDVLNTFPEYMKNDEEEVINDVEEAYKLFPDFRKYMDQYPEVYELTKQIQGTLGTPGVHAAGILISPIPLHTIAPMHITKGGDARSVSSEDGDELVLPATQYTMKQVEMLGLIKFDVLGLSTKTTLHKARNLIKARRNLDLDLANLPLNDKDVFSMLSKGKVQGCFQLDGSTGMGKAVMQIGVDCFNDLQAVVAMYRPGPMQYIELYANRKKGKVPITFAHQVVEKHTKNTYGIIAYQEQLMRVFVEMSNLSETYGYKFLKICAKKDKDIAFITESKRAFLKGCHYNGVKDDVAARVFSDLEKFAGYAFNASHAAAYAYESYKTTYLKTHYTPEYMAAIMSIESLCREFDYVKRCEEECERNFGITIEPPDINLSKVDYTIVDERRLRRSLLVDGIGMKAASEIVAKQPYKGRDIFYSFASRVDSIVNKSVVESMCSHGMFKSLNKKPDLIVKDFENIKKDKSKRKGMPPGSIF